MKKYLISFDGRQSGAIGITYKIRQTYRTNNLGEALYILWTDYEHITIHNVLENGQSIDFKGVDLIPCEISDCYPNRPTHPTTGSYYYTRSETPTN